MRKSEMMETQHCDIQSDREMYAFALSVCIEDSIRGCIECAAGVIGGDARAEKQCS